MQRRKKQGESFIKEHIFNWQTVLALGLIVVSALIYFTHYLIFQDLHHIFIFLVSDIAFVPIEVLLVTLIIHRLLEIREKRSKLKKMNMVIGVFYSEVGNKLISDLAKFDPNACQVRNLFDLKNSWTEQGFKDNCRKVLKLDFNITLKREDLSELKKFLLSERNFLLDLLENPNLIEHDPFADLLWAVFHIIEELKYRDNLQDISDKDLEHIENDILRAYVKVVEEWLFYMKHLEEDYPYLFSLAIRTNPFNPECCVEIDIENV